MGVGDPGGLGAGGERGGDDVEGGGEGGLVEERDGVDGGAGEEDLRMLERGKNWGGGDVAEYRDDFPRWDVVGLIIELELFFGIAGGCGGFGAGEFRGRGGCVHNCSWC